HHEGEVPGDDLPADAERLTLDPVRRLGGELRHLDLRQQRDLLRHLGEVTQLGVGEHQIAARLANGAARVLGLDDRDLLGALLQPVGDLVQDPAAIRLAHARPRSGIERLARRLHGALRIVATGACDACPGLLGRRIDRVDRLARGGGTELAVDVEAILLHGVPPSCCAESGSAYPSPLGAVNAGAAGRHDVDGGVRAEVRAAWRGRASRWSEIDGTQARRRSPVPRFPRSGAAMKLATAAGLLRSGQAGVLLSLQRLLKPYYRVCFLGAAAGSGLLRRLAGDPVSLD